MFGICAYAVHEIYTVISRPWLCRVITYTPHFTL
jgi:hypothetical protein